MAACLSRLAAGAVVCCSSDWDAAAPVVAEREIRDLWVGADRAGGPPGGRRALSGRPLDVGLRVPVAKQGALDALAAVPGRPGMSHEQAALEAA